MKPTMHKPTPRRAPGSSGRLAARALFAAAAVAALAGCADPLMRKSNLPEKIDFSGGGTPPAVAVRAPETSPAEPTNGPGAGSAGMSSNTAAGPASRPAAVAGEVGASTRSSDVDLSPVPAETRPPTTGPAATLPALPSRLPAPTTGPGL